MGAAIDDAEAAGANFRYPTKTDHERSRRQALAWLPHRRRRGGQVSTPASGVPGTEAEPSDRTDGPRKTAEASWIR
jgi:hypothetical protein